MNSINNLFIEKNLIMESIAYTYFDPLDYLCESIDILLEDDNNDNKNANANNDKDNLKENDKRFNFDAKKAIADMIRILIQWFTRLKDTMSAFFKGFRNLNHKKLIKEIFVDPNKHKKKIKVYNYINMRNGVANANELINKASSILNNAIKAKNPSMEDYKQQVIRAFDIDSLGGGALKARTYLCFIKKNEKIKITIGQLNEQIVSSYLLGANDTVNNIERWKNDLRSTMQKTDMDIYQQFRAGEMDQKTSRQFTSLLKTHTGIVEKICVYSMKCIKKAYSDFNRIVTKGNGTTENIENNENSNDNNEK